MQPHSLMTVIRNYLHLYAYATYTSHSYFLRVVLILLSSHYGVGTLPFSTSVWNCESKASSKMNDALLFDLFQNKLWQISFFFLIWEHKFQNE